MHAMRMLATVFLHSVCPPVCVSAAQRFAHCFSSTRKMQGRGATRPVCDTCSVCSLAEFSVTSNKLLVNYLVPNTRHQILDPIKYVIIVPCQRSLNWGFLYFGQEHYLKLPAKPKVPQLHKLLHTNDMHAFLHYNR